MPTRSELVVLNAAIKKYFGSPAAKQLATKSKCMIEAQDAPLAVYREVVTQRFAHLSNLQIQGGSTVLMAAKPYSHNPSLVMPSVLRTPTTPAIQMHMFAASALSTSTAMARA